ncbi:MAG: HAMP domain-containing sensor histidine kinase [Chloroflexota bacterium]
MTLRTRLALWYSGLLVLLVSILSITVITVSRVTLLQTVDNILIEATDDVLNSIDPLPVAEFDSPDAVELFFRSEDVFKSPGFSVQIWRTHQDGELLETPILERSSDSITSVTDPLDPNFLATETDVVNSITLNGIPERVLTHPFYDRAGDVIGVIQVATPIVVLADANDQLLIITLGAAAGCIVLSIGLGMWLSRHLLKPIASIKEAASNIAVTDDLSTRLAWNGAQDELGELTEAMNKMMERLENLFQVQQQFISDVSHELRTPLTSIIGHLDLMERYGYDQESFEALHREGERMSRMVNDLILLTRADFGEMTIDLYPIDIDTIVLEVYNDSIVRLKDRDLKLALGRIEPVRATGNADRMRELLHNLVGNAMKFTADDGTVTLSTYPEHDHAIIEVSDTGIGISEDDLKRIFDRFYQASSARTRHYDSDGAGLGLSIARWIVDTHNGHIEVQSTLGKGTTFRVQIPLEQDEAHIPMLSTRIDENKQNGIVRIVNRSS